MVLTLRVITSVGSTSSESVGGVPDVSGLPPERKRLAPEFRKIVTLGLGDGLYLIENKSKQEGLYKRNQQKIQKN